jgi:hypothetical protein
VRFSTGKVGNMSPPLTSAQVGDANGREAVLREALVAARAIPQGFYWYPTCLACVAVHLPNDERDAVLREAVAAARTLRHFSWRGLAFVKIAPSLPEPDRDALLRELVDGLNAEPNKTCHPTIWRMLLPHLREPQRMSVVQDMLAAVREPGRLNRVEVLEALAPYLPEALFPDALAIARKSSLLFPSAARLARLVPYLPDVWIPDMFVEVTTTSGIASVLAALAPRLPLSLRSRAIEIAVQPMFEVHVRCQVLAALAPHLSEPHLRAALGFCRNLHGLTAGNVCADTVSALAPYLPVTLLPEAFAVAREIPDNPLTEHLAGSAGVLCRSRAFVALAPYLPEALLGDALTDYVSVPKRFFATIGTHAWSAFVPRLSGALLPAAVAAVAAIDDACPRVMFSAILAQRLADDERQRVVRDALADTAMIPATRRAHALTELAPYLPAARSRTELYEAFTEVLADLCLPVSTDPPPSSAGPGFKAHVRWWNDHQDGALRGDALTALAPHLPKELLLNALAAARTIHSDQHFVRTLIALLPFL